MKTENIKKTGYPYLTVAAVVCCFIVTVLVLLTAFTYKEGDSPVKPESSVPAPSQSSEPSVPEISEPYEESEKPEEKVEFKTVNIENTKVMTGDLILVNAQTGYSHPDVKSLVNIFENRNGAYKCGDTSGRAEKRALEAFNALTEKFAEQTGRKSVTAVYGYLTEAEANAKYKNAADKDLAVKGGYSDFHTGLSFMLRVYPQSEGTMGEGDFLVLENLAPEYGFILRAPEGEEDITGLSASAGHYRYVGIPAAGYIAHEGIALEEFCERVRTCNAFSPLRWEVNGTEYAAYYQPMSAGDETELKVPVNMNYTVSGNNAGGFIVIMNK